MQRRCSGDGNHTGDTKGRIAPIAAEGPAARESRARGIRFRLSLLFLVLALNCVALVALSVALITNLALDIEPGRQLRGEVAVSLDELHRRVLREGVLPASSGTEPIQQDLVAIEGRLAARGAAGRKAARSVQRYRQAVAGWRETVATRSRERTDTAPPGNAAAETQPLMMERQALQQLESRRREVIESVSALPDTVNPPWLEAAIPLVPWVFAWVVALTLLTLHQVYRLRLVLTEPLERLTAAAAAVSAGDLHRDMPLFRGTGEIEDLTGSIRAMRDQLVASIEDLDTRNQHVSTILENLEDGVLHVDAKGRIQEYNARAAQILALCCDVELASGQKLDRLLPDVEDDWFLAGNRRECEIALERGEKEVHLEVRSRPVEPMAAGEATERGHVVVIRDVTHLREIEKLKREFVSVVTHELKTPLTSIEGYTKLLLMGKGGSLSERQLSILAVIAEQSAILKNMIQDLLDIRRMETGRLPLSRTQMAIDDLLNSAFQAHAGEARTRGLRFRLEIDPAAKTVTVNVDPLRMQQVVGNLLQNAFKFTPSGGEVILATGRSGDEVWFSVSDTGRGIPQDALPRLFDRFFQVDTGDVRLSGGAGLGLYISRELVSAHGGQIEVISTEGEGSTFTVRLPASGHAADSGKRG